MNVCMLGKITLQSASKVLEFDLGKTISTLSAEYHGGNIDIYIMYRHCFFKVQGLETRNYCEIEFHNSSLVKINNIVSLALSGIVTTISNAFILLLPH